MTTPSRPTPSRRPSLVWQMSDEGKVVVDLDRPARPFGSPDLKSNPGDDVVTTPPRADETDEGAPVDETEDDVAPEM